MIRFWIYFLRNNYQDISKQEWVFVYRDRGVRREKLVVNRVEFHNLGTVSTHNRTHHPRGVIQGLCFNIVKEEINGVKIIKLL